MHAHCTDSRKSGGEKRTGHNPPEINITAILIYPYPVFLYAHNIQNWDHIIHATLYPYTASIYAFPRWLSIFGK